MRKLIPLSWVLMAAPFAWAHAVLLHASPEARSTVSGPVIPVTLRFNSRVDAMRSRLVFVQQGREQVLTPSTQTSPDVIQSSVQDARPGACRIRWQVLASDGHITRGEFIFLVK